MKGPSGPRAGARLAALVVAVGATCAVFDAAATQPSRVSLGTGPVVGAIDAGIASFKGLPYAAPPVGELRWQPPQPLPSTAGSPAARSADRFGNACHQKRGLSLEGGGDPGLMSEDCLYLNVFTPRAEPAARLPVMVWLHGGALIFGAGGLPLYDGSALARRGVVVVTVNYRLGPLGFFAHPALEGAGSKAPVNFGLLDQIAALRWVQQNIAAFGGDPARVTLFGQSAGAQSVLALYTSPLARGLFQQGIVQSSYGLPSHTRAKARATGVAVADAVGLPGAAATAAQLRAVPAERLAQLDGQNLSLAPSFIVGDEALPLPVLDAFQQGRQARLPLLIGSNSDDASVALAFGIEPAALVKRLGAANILVRPLYPDVADDSQLGREVARDLVFTAYARRIAYLHSTKAATWRYWFEHVPDGVRASSVGAPHGGEVTTVFGTGDQCGCLTAPLTDADRAVERRVGDRWAAFAATGTPTKPGMIEWPADARRAPVVLDIGDVDEVRPAFMQPRLDAFILALRWVTPRPAADPAAATGVR